MQLPGPKCAIACLLVTAMLVMSWSIGQSRTTSELSPDISGRSQETIDRSRTVNAAQDGVLRSPQKPKVPISEGGTAKPTTARFTAAGIDSSMRARRELAWAIVEQVWAS